MIIKNDLIPRYSKADFDPTATEFLSEYFPEALEFPMCVPIRTIVQKRFGLRILERHLTEEIILFFRINGKQQDKGCDRCNGRGLCSGISRSRRH